MPNLSDTAKYNICGMYVRTITIKNNTIHGIRHNVSKVIVILSAIETFLPNIICGAVFH
jgi:hypothetical protein